MQTRDQDTLNIHTPPEPAGQRKARSRLAYLGAILIVALIVGVSATVFSLWRVRHGQGTNISPFGQTVAPPSGQWIQALNGYSVTAIEAVQSNPAVLYACAVHGPLKAGYDVQYTIMRSSDFGSRWQDVGSQAAISGSCQLAVNPANSDELYVVSGPMGASGSGAISYALKHSTNSGQTWTTISPTVHSSDIPSGFPWNVQQITFAGSSLFGTQWVPIEAAFPHPEFMPDGSFPMARLVESTDGGHTWVVVDSHFDATKQGVRSYAVDPSDPRTIYDIVGAGWPIPADHAQENSLPTIYGLNEALYKTTDGGATWTLLLNNLRFVSSVRLASGTPNIVYVGGTQGLFPREGQQGGVTEQPQASVYRLGLGNFLLNMSSDGGAHWRTVTKDPQLMAVLNWFVSIDGQVYTRSTIVEGGAKIVRYNPATDRWSDVSPIPTSRTLIAVTPGDAQHGAVLWLVSSGNELPTLYRYVV
jgi:hypothetical protein